VIFTQALNEMQHILKQLGGKAQTALGLAGLGDLYTTSKSTHSRNRAVGFVLGTNGDGHLESEGFISLKSLAILLNSELKHLPLLKALIAIALDHAPPQILSQTLFK